MIYAFDEYLLDADRRELRRGAALIAAEPQTFDLLLYLIQNRERVVSKDDLMAAVWSGRIVSESTLSSQINAVRRAIGDDGERQILVRTLPRKGFRFVGEVEERCARERLSVGEAADTPQPADGPEAARSRSDRPERRQLSVMICNLIGAGAHSAAQDPEDLLAITSACQVHIQAVTNPLTFWVQATRFMWMPWLLTAQTMLLPADRPRTLPSAVYPQQKEPRLAVNEPKDQGKDNC